MKIAIWVKQEIEVDKDVLLRMADEEYETFTKLGGATDEFGIESLLHRADNADEVNLPSEEWRLDEEFDGTYTRDDLANL